MLMLNVWVRCWQTSYIVNSSDLSPVLFSLFYLWCEQKYLSLYFTATERLMSIQRNSNWINFKSTTERWSLVNIVRNIDRKKKKQRSKKTFSNQKEKTEQWELTNKEKTTHAFTTHTSEHRDIFIIDRFRLWVFQQNITVTQLTTGQSRCHVCHLTFTIFSLARH